jgi:hypothetical protein
VHPLGRNARTHWPQGRSRLRRSYRLLKRCASTVKSLVVETMGLEPHDPLLAKPPALSAVLTSENAGEA